MLHFHTVNECEIENGGCGQICLDRTLLYECRCMEGYELNQDNHICKGKCFKWANMPSKHLLPLL